MKNNMTLLAAGLAISLIAGVASAATAPAMSNSSMQKLPNGAVIGVTAGYAAFQSPSSASDAFGADLTGFNTSTSRGAFAAGAFGGYLFGLNQHLLLGPVVAYTWYGNDATYKVSDNSGSAKVVLSGQSVSALAKVEYLFTSNWNINATAGAAYMMQKAKGSVTGAWTLTGPSSYTENKINPQVGAGFGYLFNNGVGVGADVNYIFGATGNSTSNNTYAVASVMGNVSYTFN